MELSHVNKAGYAKMVDVSEKSDTMRKAIARATIVMNKETLQRIIDG
ncbi:MAG: cyclic pyranopterin monophosphate synthase MoaC, partial [Firmicutes bacterium]|nr:cyclic pyranopterin monophosphate synthase MoaC [Bacillota bacterium]